jgi:hypothetical protein
MSAPQICTGIQPDSPVWETLQEMTVGHLARPERERLDDLAYAEAKAAEAVAYIESEATEVIGKTATPAVNPFIEQPRSNGADSDAD